MWAIVGVSIVVIICCYLLWKLYQTRQNRLNAEFSPTETTPLLKKAPEPEVVADSQNASIIHSDQSTDQSDFLYVDCVEDMSYAARQEDDYMSERDIQKNMSALKYSRLMKEIRDEATLRAIVKTMRKITVRKGESVILQGDINGRVYYVMESGAIDVYVFDQFRVRLQPGWCFGELSFVFGAPRSASCVASAESVLWALDRDQFDRIMKGQPPLENLRIVRQQSDPMRCECEEDFESEEELTKRASFRLYGESFLEDSVRLLPKEFLEQLLERDYIGVPDQIRLALEAFQKRNTDLKFDLKKKQVVPA